MSDTNPLPSPPPKRGGRSLRKNVFVLCAGRCGSATFAEACKVIGNWSVRHESGSGRYDLIYPERHIEVDNRLAWMLGLLGSRYADERTLYVFLRRRYEDVVGSFVRRWSHSAILRAWCDMLGTGRGRNVPEGRRQALVGQYVRTVEANIAMYLQGRAFIEIWMHDAEDPDYVLENAGFIQLWEQIDARGDLAAALAELGKRHNRGKDGRK